VTAATYGARRHAESIPNPQQKGHSHGTYWRIQADEDRLLRAHPHADARHGTHSLVPVDNTDAENAPDYRIHLGDDDGPEIGAGWKRTGEKAGDYVSLQIDDPTFAQPIRANLFQADDKGTAFNLLWNRPPRRNETV
jgi:uncharacterized protein (DUF736 family)